MLKSPPGARGDFILATLGLQAFFIKKFFIDKGEKACYNLPPPGARGDFIRLLPDCKLFFYTKAKKREAPKCLPLSALRLCFIRKLFRQPFIQTFHRHEDGWVAIGKVRHCDFRNSVNYIIFNVVRRTRHAQITESSCHGGDGGGGGGGGEVFHWIIKISKIVEN